MIYLDHAATSLQKPETVYAAVNHAMRTCAGAGRSGHAAAREAEQVLFDCRSEAAALFDAEPDQVVFTANCTHGLNIAIRSLVNSGDRVVISGFEHNAVLRTLFHLGVDIHVAGRKVFSHEDTLSAFDAAVDERTAAVICTHVSNVFGYILPIEAIARLCRRKHVPLIIDAAQSAGVLPVSLKTSGAAFVAMPGHKSLYGPQGTGILLCNQVPKPFICGGTGSGSRSRSMPDFLPDAAEAGTHNTHGIAGLCAGIRYVRESGIHLIHQHSWNLLQRLHGKIPDIPHYFADHNLQSGALSLLVPGVDCEIAAARLASEGIAVRAGLHCSPVAHESVGTLQTGTVRISVSMHNTDEEIDALADVLNRMK